MDRDTDIVPSSPSISSVSSSDLDTESTGSFFHDRSTSLGTLMGVSIPEISARAARAPLQRGAADGGGGAASTAAGEGGVNGGGGRKQRAAAAAATAERRRRRHRRGGGGRRWWSLCREEDLAAPTSLGEFLQVERRLSGDGAAAHGNHFFFGAAEHEAVGGGALFEDGRVLPPPPSQQHHRGETGLGRLPVMLTGICSGGEG